MTPPRSRLERIRAEWGGEDARWLLETVDGFQKASEALLFAGAMNAGRMPMPDYALGLLDALSAVCARLEEPDASV